MGETLAVLSKSGVVFAVLAFVFFLLALRAWRRKDRYEKQTEAMNDTEILIGTEADLLAAEAELAKGNPRDKLLETHVLLDRYNTIQGFTQQYMDDMTNFLRAKGISCDYTQQDTLPPGAVAGLERMRFFELFVHKDQADEAIELVEEFKRRTS